MILNESEKDALSELINIGFGRAANALSILVGRRVLLDAPIVSLHPLPELARALSSLSNLEMTTIHQVFTGALSGDMMLLLDADSASILTDLLNGGPGRVRPMAAPDHETLAETGNILLSAFCGSFGNLLHVHISFTVPNLRLESVQQMLNTLTVGSDEIQYALVVRIFFRLAAGSVSGYVIIVMGINSLESLINAMKTEGYLI
jgi:chemotaxis protein CheC